MTSGGKNPEKGEKKPIIIHGGIVKEHIIRLIPGGNEAIESLSEAQKFLLNSGIFKWNLELPSFNFVDWDKMDVKNLGEGVDKL